MFYIFKVITPVTSKLYIGVRIQNNFKIKIPTSVIFTLNSSGHRHLFLLCKRLKASAGLQLRSLVSVKSIYSTEFSKNKK